MIVLALLPRGSWSAVAFVGFLMVAYSVVMALGLGVDGDPWSMAATGVALMLPMLFVTRDR